MPLYEYQCEVCGKVTEFLDSASTKRTDGFCPNCKEDRKLNKIFSVTASVSKSGSDFSSYASAPASSGCGSGCG
ncbi:zinc ribbon domain-containing protein [bacterium]|jgi:putative FmdB family regulatory protein|nr:zinc ribbon domain-containing protein [bacterium]